MGYKRRSDVKEFDIMKFRVYQGKKKKKKKIGSLWCLVNIKASRKDGNLSIVSVVTHVRVNL